MAIQLSLQENNKSLDTGSSDMAYHKTSEDLTVDCFLKSLAGRHNN